MNQKDKDLDAECRLRKNSEAVWDLYYSMDLTE